jgi:hypothetical protein
MPEGQGDEKNDNELKLIIKILDIIESLNRKAAS